MTASSKRALPTLFVMVFSFISVCSSQANPEAPIPQAKPTQCIVIEDRSCRFIIKGSMYQVKFEPTGDIALLPAIPEGVTITIRKTRNKVHKNDNTNFTVTCMGTSKDPCTLEPPQ
jgi:hypothetical protein